MPVQWTGRPGGVAENVEKNHPGKEINNFKIIFISPGRFKRLAEDTIAGSIIRRELLLK